MPPPPQMPLPEDGASYPVSAFVLRYLHEGHPGLPPLAEVMQLEIALLHTEQGYVAPREGVPSEMFSLADLSGPASQDYYGSAIQKILEGIRDYFTGRHFLGVYVAPYPLQIDSDSMDLRRPQETTLDLVITTAIVTDMRTVASGDRIDPQERINNPAHARILEQSPIQPYAAGDEERDDLLRGDQLDEYLFRKSRHPGRRVDAAVSTADMIGAVDLDLRITENKDWFVYGQLSNTGTEATDEWRQAVGFVANQLTNNDDILTVDAATASFEETWHVFGSYDAPIGDSQLWRWKAYGGYSQFDASDVGQFLQFFKGETWGGGGEVSYNIYQSGNLFVDVLGGARYENDSVDNRFGPDASEWFLLPYAGVELEKQAEWYNVFGRVTFDFNPNAASASQVDLNRLGRLLPDKNWVLMRWDLYGSVYLEPLFNRSGWGDPTSPKSSTLAHEFAVGLRGQYAFDNRLIPQHQQVIGGLYTVRGYPQSLVASDNAVIVNAEYRLHIPRLLGLDPEPPTLFRKPFRVAPQWVYGRPDWDLIVRGFFDYGRVVQSDKLFFERDFTLMGAGAGVEVEYRRYIMARLDWGYALRDVGSLVDEGDTEWHFVLTVLY